MMKLDKKCRDSWEKRGERTRGGKHYTWDNSTKNESRLAQNKRNEEIKREAMKKSADERHQRRLSADEVHAAEQREKAGIEFGVW